MDPKPETLQENVILKFRNLRVAEIVKLGLVDLRWVYSKDLKCIFLRLMKERKNACFGVASVKGKELEYIFFLPGSKLCLDGKSGRQVKEYFAKYQQFESRS